MEKKAISEKRFKYKNLNGGSRMILEEAMDSYYRLRIYSILEEYIYLYDDQIADKYDDLSTDINEKLKRMYINRNKQLGEEFVVNMGEVLSDFKKVKEAEKKKGEDFGAEEEKEFFEKYESMFAKGSIYEEYKEKAFNYGYELIVEDLQEHVKGRNDLNEEEMAVFNKSLKVFSMLPKVRRIRAIKLIDCGAAN